MHHLFFNLGILVLLSLALAFFLLLAAYLSDKLFEENGNFLVLPLLVIGVIGLVLIFIKLKAYLALLVFISLPLLAGLGIRTLNLATESLRESEEI